MADWDRREWLHIYGQYIYHSEATIRGTSEGLNRLRSAIDAALAEGRSEAVVMASDGEGYGVVIEKVSLHDQLGSPEYLYEAEFRLMKQEAERAREFGLRNPQGKYRRVDDGFPAPPRIEEIET